MSSTVSDPELLAFLQELFPTADAADAADGFTSNASALPPASAAATRTISPKRSVVIRRPTAKRSAERKIQNRHYQHKQQQRFLTSSLGKLKIAPASSKRRNRVPIDKQRMYDRRAAEKKKSTIEEVVVEYVFYSVAYLELLKLVLPGHAHGTAHDRIQRCEDALERTKEYRTAAKCFKFEDDQRTLESELKELRANLAGECRIKKEPLFAELSF